MDALSDPGESEIPAIFPIVSLIPGRNKQFTYRLWTPARIPFPSASPTLGAYQAAPGVVSMFPTADVATYSRGLLTASARENRMIEFARSYIPEWKPRFIGFLSERPKSSLKLGLSQHCHST